MERTEWPDPADRMIVGLVIELIVNVITLWAL